jgi:hypothetical protein
MQIYTQRLHVYELAIGTPGSPVGSSVSSVGFLNLQFKYQTVTFHPLVAVWIIQLYQLEAKAVWKYQYYFDDIMINIFLQYVLQYYLYWHMVLKQIW